LNKPRVSSIRLASELWTIIWERCGEETIPQVVNAASAKGQPEFTQVPPVDHAENVVINKIPSTTQPQVLQVLIGEPSSTKVDIPEDI